MHRFYCPSPNISEGKIIIDDISQIHHLKDVLRLKVKDKIVIFEAKGKEYESIIERLSPISVVLVVKNTKEPINFQKIKITIACAIPKKSKFEDVVDKLTQLGVERIIPLISERVVVKIEGGKGISKLERWRKIALSASQQSQRNSLPVIEGIKSLKEVLLDSKAYELKLIPTLEGKRKSISQFIDNPGLKSVMVLIGPEGDFTSQEVLSAKSQGFIPISLGSSVLRVETAAVAVASYLKFSFL